MLRMLRSPWFGNAVQVAIIAVLLTAAFVVGPPANATPAPIRVAELDTGVQWEHAWLAGDVNIAQGWTAPWLVRPAGAPGQDNHYIGHGTIVADILTSSGHATVIPVKVCSGWGACADHAGPDVDGVVAGINYAVSTGARVITASISSKLHSPAIDAAIEDADSHGVVVIAIAGNAGGYSAPGWTPDLEYPLGSTSSKIITVGGYDFDGPTYYRWPGSTPSSYVDLLADVNGLNAGCWYDYLHADQAPCNVTNAGAPAVIGGQGTSFSAPRVAEAVARMLQANPSLTTAQVRQVLTATSIPIQSCGPGCGAGRLDADAAVAMARTLPNGCGGSSRGVEG